MNETKPNANNNASQNSGDALMEYLKEDFFPKHGTKVIIALCIVAICIFAFAQNLKVSSEKEIAMAEELGKGLSYMYAGETDSALTAFEEAINSGVLKGLSLAKATLLAGNIHLQSLSLDNAEALYKQTISNASGVEIITSAAEHGLAVVAMERQNYPEAISLLNAFVNKYGKRTGDLAKRYAKTEPVDKVPTVPSALWKLALCYLETGDSDKAAKTAEKILKIYGDAQKIADDASKLLATLEK